MIVEAKDSLPFPEKTSDPLQGNNGFPPKDLVDVVFWALRKLIPIEQRLYASGVFDLIENVLIEQKIHLVWFFQTRSSQVNRQLLVLAAQGLEASPRRTNHPDLTEVLVWAIRKIVAIENRLYSTGVFSYVDNWLTDQEAQLMSLLRKHPKHIKRELAVLQHRQALDEKSGQRHVQTEDRGEC
ncbi:MAG: hypothetical protein ACE5OZ_20030 [Candidatus Heimdallarchaeota archaeon]